MNDRVGTRTREYAATLHSCILKNKHRHRLQYRHHYDALSLFRASVFSCDTQHPRNAKDRWITSGIRVFHSHFRCHSSHLILTKHYRQYNNNKHSRLSHKMFSVYRRRPKTVVAFAVISFLSIFGIPGSDKIVGIPIQQSPDVDSEKKDGTSSSK